VGILPQRSSADRMERLVSSTNIFGSPSRPHRSEGARRLPTLLLALALWACAAPEPQPAATTTLPGGGAWTKASLAAAQVMPGDRVTASGTVVVKPGEAPAICRPFDDPQTGASAAQPPVCSPISARLDGLDVSALPHAEERAGVRFSEWMRVDGVWTDRAIHVDSMEWLGPPTGASVDVPCPAPDGGWPDPPPADLAGEAAVARLASEVASHPDLYAGYWGAETARASATSGSTTTVLVVAVVGDPGEARSRLDAVYAFGLCLVEAKYSAADLDRVARALAGQPGQLWGPQVDPSLNRVRVILTMLDADWVDRLSAYPEAFPDLLVTKVAD